jgi:hypothetical protein
MTEKPNLKAGSDVIVPETVYKTAKSEARAAVQLTAATIVDRDRSSRASKERLDATGLRA